MDSDNTETAPKTFLLIAEHRHGHGSGHLHRCARLARELDGQVDWLLPEDPPDGHYSRRDALRMLGEPELPIRWTDSPASSYDIVIIDRREMTAAELNGLPDARLVIGIDLAGEARDRVDFAIDTLETPEQVAPPNIADSGLLHLPDTVRDEWPREIRHVLVVFGGTGSGATAAETGAAIPVPADGSVSVVAAPDTQVPPGLTVLRPSGDLSERLHQYDLVVTHYGLTAYEATWARVPVVLLNPSPYHERLAERAGFRCVERGTDLSAILKHPDSVVEAGRRIRPAGRSSLGDLVNGLLPPPRPTSPVDDRRFASALERFAERTFFRHPETGLVFMKRYRPATISYDREYFFSEYERQYGRTYLEDFDHIAAMGRRRMGRILKYHGRHRRPRLLDIGCAYGPFLRAAADSGADVLGVDVADDAVRYVTETLGLPARTARFPDTGADELGGPFDIVTMWYVIEHFPDLDRVLERVADLIRPGGLFAFSSPHGRGISARRDLREFLRRSPEDHHTVLDRHSLNAVLSRFGFRLREFRSTGHHPERFGLPLGRRAAAGQGFRYGLLRTISTVGGLGDTFEAIAERSV